MPARNDTEENPQEPSREESNEFRIKTHVDGDFRFSKPALARFGFGNKQQLKVTILECSKNGKVKLQIEKV